METNYKSNSNKSKEEAKTPERQKLEKAIVGGVKKKKKSELKKIASEFVKEDFGNIKTYLVKDVVIPNVKRVLADIIQNTVDMLFYGEIRSGRSRSGTGASRISYGDLYDSRRSGASEQQQKRKSVYAYDYDDIVIESKSEAEDIIERMGEVAEKYGMVTVGDLYDLVGLEVQHTDYNYGWTDLRGSYPDPVNGGYLLKFPKIVSIK